ncbi:ABC transporter ATP-binding protein [Paenarthrobacter ureafaciens]|jgi:putative spermidine/putrescine transport system ATP-binding protein|uniref:ABC transporter ATP-binding protein n=1 Tax=Paenarthrobacter ureafaciens TaxID=37931 RepID=UPI001C2BE05E|nr:ABC transporter ATP-binding protein [Paenarthrobacter ureafaciens]
MTSAIRSTGHGILIEGVTKKYPHTEKPAVDNVSLDIAGGEFVTFLGPSGSGKSTTLSMIAGFTSLTAGSIVVGGQDISGLKPHKRNLGVVFQQYALFPHMTVRENIAYPLQQRKYSKAEVQTKVQAALELVSLGNLGNRLPKELSGGQQQRVALARAVVYEPGALLLDEPLGALDKKLRDGLQRQIARMHRELGMTFIFVTHDQEEALTLSDRIAVFNEGRIEQVGTPTELYEKPDSLFVAEFLGESNVFKGQQSALSGRLDCSQFSVDLSAEQQKVCRKGGAVVVRPERIQLDTYGSTPRPGYICTAGTISDITYVGNRHRIGLSFPDGTTGSAMQIAGTALPALPGEQVLVSWDAANHSIVSAPTGGPSPAQQPNNAKSPMASASR